MTYLFIITSKKKTKRKELKQLTTTLFNSLQFNISFFTITENRGQN